MVLGPPCHPPVQKHCPGVSTGSTMVASWRANSKVTEQFAPMKIPSTSKKTHFCSFSYESFSFSDDDDDVVVVGWSWLVLVGCSVMAVFQSGIILPFSSCFRIKRKKTKSLKSQTRKNTGKCFCRFLLCIRFDFYFLLNIVRVQKFFISESVLV